MQDLTINEIKNFKNLLEHEISILVIQFENRTFTSIREIIKRNKTLMLDSGINTTSQSLIKINIDINGL